METIPIEIDDQDGALQLDGVYEDERLRSLRISLIEAQLAALRAYKPFLNASIEFALAFLFGSGSEVVPMDTTPSSMWRKSAVAESKARSKQAKKAQPESIISLPLKCVVVYDYLLPGILADYKKHAPNEYAFICSGYVVDGIATLTDYYPGEMALSTPVVCRLDEEFARDVVYDQVPPSHNIICWSHVHPIEVPSSTDREAFDTHAKWDEEVLSRGLLEKRSLGMIISGATHKITVFDTHDYRRPLRHFVIPFKGKQERKTE
jgi:hypothetical protein